MSKIFVKDLKINETIDSVFIVKQKQIMTSKNTGNSFAVLKLVDRTGEVEAKMWDSLETLEPVTEGSFVRIYGAVSEYNSKAQLTIKKIKIADEKEYVIADFIRYTAKNVEEMFKNVLGIIESFTDNDLKKLLGEFMNDKTIAEKFKKAPAAVAMHSACIGGLLEHVDSMLLIGLFVADQYPSIKRDLLLAGIILHDIGKIHELEYTTMFKYSDAGKLIGHIAIGVQMLDEKIKQIPDFPAEKKLILEHMILAHHGEAEFGSPRSPMTLEAIVLYQLDNLEAKITGFNDFVELNRQPDSPWTPRSFMFDNRELYLGR